MQYDGVLTKRNLDTETDTQGEQRVQVDAESEGMYLKAKEHPGLLTDRHQRPGGRHGADFPLEGARPTRTLVLDFYFQNSDKINFHCFKQLI